MGLKEICSLLFYDEGLKEKEVAKNLDISVQAVYKHLKSYNMKKYEEEKRKRQNNGWKNIVLSLFYDEGLKVKEVAQEVGMSSAYISKFLSNDNPERYINEKERRKKEKSVLRAEKEKVRKRNWKKNNEKTGRTDYDLVKRQHFIDVGVLSYERIR